MIVILCRRKAGHRFVNAGKREAANCSNFRPYAGGMTYLEEEDDRLNNSMRRI